VTGRSNVIALWIGDVRFPYFARAMHHVEHQLKQHGMDVIRISGRHNDRHAIFHGAADGILAFDGVENVHAYLENAPAGHPPIVSLGCYCSEQVDFVGVDLYAGAKAAAEHLISQGCRRIAYLVSEWGNRPGDVRHEAYLSAMAAAGRPPEIITAPAAHRAPARVTMAQYVAENGHPDGLFCFSDEMAIGAYRGLRDRGLRIPEDVAVIGCDGIEDTEYLDSPLSTILQPTGEMCALAWQYLRQRINEPDTPLQQTILEARLVLRESSRR
jgi:LacI family transcriptional regulator